MFRLTREVRFSLNDTPSQQPAPTNSYGGFPSLTGFGQFVRLQVTLEGKLDPRSSYLRNIKDVDDAVRQRVIEYLDSQKRLALSSQPHFASRSPACDAFGFLRSGWEPDKLHAVTLWLTPYLALTQLASEYPMHTRLSQKFEFSASHRLHNPSLTDEENARVFGKCNHANGHGHNYEVQVTLRGGTNEHGLLIEVPNFEKIVGEFALRKLDHKNLNVDVPEFASLIPTVENIAMVVFRMLKNRFTGIGAELASVTVWETPKTWCEYAED